jgi:predicted AAA+ superfamily ATPase
MHRLFELGCRYSGQELSFTKMLGQLQDSGNTVTLSHYLDLLGSAGLLSGIEKYSGSIVRQRSSSPKFIVHNTALMSSAATELFKEITTLPERWGRFVESAIGAHLLDGHVKGYYSLHYWRHGNDEADFVLVKGDSITALEVKSGGVSGRRGLSAFSRLYRQARIILIGEKGIPWQEFLKQDMSDFV